MAIRLADTARPNNYVDEDNLGTYPVAYAEDVWFSDDTRLSDKTFDGQSIQKEELPLASADELGNIYQYIGETGTYNKGYFYECISDDEATPTYSWKEVISSASAIIDTEELPSTSIKNTFYRVVHDNMREHTVDYTQEVSWAMADEYAQSFSDFLTENNITHGLKLRGDTTNTASIYNIEQPLYLDTNDVQLKDKPVVKILFFEKDFALGYMSITTSDTTVAFTDSGSLFTFYIGENKNEYYAGSENNQSLERMATYADIPDVSKKPNTFTGTQEEWDALTTEEKTQYSIVNITDDESAAQSDIYSTEETKTNKVWIDGKPIYRKVVWYFQNGSLADGVTFISGTFYTTDKFPSDVDTLTDYVGMSERSDGFVDKFASSEMVPNKTTRQLHFQTSNSHVNVFVIYEYTKTTDG